ncbi:hypothetical protein T459_28682 [Capsicum annuum]|uniref:Protein N-lysine methyltransferase METTL21A n=1 Tax=Capsicum annuum TaxID=4072 RepID=A0A2G2YHJ5_CAPAN|nr:hypothetical protein T459_28682 [Capsicum annuum]
MAIVEGEKLMLEGVLCWVRKMSKIVLPNLPMVLNSPHTSAIFIDVLGHQLQFCQDPNSKHLGTTVWDASMVLVKFLERNCRKGRFSPSKLRGKRVVELGAGCGVAGFGMALLGCDVVSTDQTEVLPLLMRNVERNTSRIMQTISDPDSFGSIQAAELDWGNETHIKAVGPPFDFIIGTDVVYAEHLLEPLLQTIIALSGPKTTILLGYEIRSTNVHEKMLEMWKRNFEVKTVPKAKMDSTYQHPSIQLYIMNSKPQGSTSEIVTPMAQQQNDEVTETETNHGSDEDESKHGFNQDDVTDNEGKVDNSLVMDLENRKLSDWEARRCGAMAARLLRDVKIT